MKGLELSEHYYFELVEPAIRESCPEALPHLAAGLAGEGSDCFGFDDEVSKDHDWGPRVCLWLPDAAYERFFPVLSAVLSSLPDTFRGEVFSLRTPEAAGRQGVLRIGDFYSVFTGSPEGPRSWRDWLSLPESHLAACSNGKVFYDGPGRFSLIRHHIMNGCPEDVRKKRLAARIALMAHSGQYNYSRCLKHGEPVAAFLSLSEFLQHGLAAVYYLNRRFMPFYKWAHRGLRELPLLSETADLFLKLTNLPQAPSFDPENADITGLSEAEALIEEICAIILQELVRQDLCRPGDSFLLPHAEEIMQGIEDPEIRRLPLMLG
ncbi:MAG: DUF4037 domain-containing protein [Stomatobaculum sp.]|nr:DUF4037 domain-containing protein [Stomatobaculum sp.]